MHGLSLAVAGIVVTALGACAEESAAPHAAALHAAAKAGDIEAVRAELDRGVGVDALDEHFGATPLLGAAARGHEPVVALLLERGADSNARMPGNEYTPLY